MSLYDRIQRSDAPKKSSPGDNTTLPCRNAGIADGGIRVGQSDADASLSVVREEQSEKPGVATQQVKALHLPKPKMGRPRTGYIKAEYNRQYSADLRTIKRLGLEITVAEWRKTK